MLAAPAWLEAVAAPPQLSVSLALSVLYIGVGPGCIAFLAWNEGVRRMGPNGASAFLNTLPFYTAVIATVAIGEVPGAPAFAGGALIIAGCLWATLGSPAKV
jgi:drug/metabolite transporter (DMT)-like permease